MWYQFNASLVADCQTVPEAGDACSWQITSDAHEQLRTGRRLRRGRVTTACQRLAANSRERRRMSLLNAAFDALRRHVPVFAYERRPSRCDTLRLAARYIAVMTELLAVIDLTQSELTTCPIQMLHHVQCLAVPLPR